MSPAPARLLIVSGGGFQGLALLRLARAAKNVHVALVDCYEDNLSRHLADRFAVVPRLHDEVAFVEALLAFVAADHTEHVFPATDRELSVLARHRARFEALGAQVAVSSLDLLEQLRDKGRMAAWLEARALPSLPLVDPRDPSLWPIFGKPRQGWGGLGVVVVRRAQDLAALAPGWEASHVWQPCLEGFVEYSADLCFDPGGRASPLVLRERVRTSSGFAVVAAQVSGRPDLEALVEALAARLSQEGARGLYNVQVLEHGGALWISDINPRVGTSSVFSLGAGVDLVGHWLGERAQRPAARPLTMVRVLEERWFLDLRGLGLRGVVFDVDDTLVDQRRWMFHKMRLAGQRLGVEDEARWREQALMLLEDNEKARFVDEMARAFGWGEARRVALLEAFREALPEASDVEYSDVKPALEALRAAGFVLATLTDARRAPHAQKMARLGLDGLWAAEVCAGELGAAKPDGRVFEAAARALELPASSLLMVGDHLGRDVLGAARAGYGAACHLQREGGFHRGHAGLGGWWPAPSAPLAQARSLTEVAWMLGVGR